SEWTEYAAWRLCVWSEIKLQQPQSSEVKRPGNTVKISCVTSGRNTQTTLQI
uniref:Ig-like domain-containing protein n=1 Tax=Poecilia latipinna TaxID=48699 RepID=A0A3B3VIY3_9TELE